MNHTAETLALILESCNANLKSSSLLITQIGNLAEDLKELQVRIIALEKFVESCVY